MDEKNFDITKEYKVEELIPTPEKLDEELVIVTFDEISKKKKEKKPNFFKNLFEKFMGLKTSIKIVIILLLILFIFSIVILVLLLNKNEEKPDNTKPDETEVIVKDNYRYEDGVLTILNDNDEEVGKYTCTNKNETKCYVAYTLADDNFNVSKKVNTRGEEYNTRTRVYHDRYVFIYDNKNEENGVIVLYDLKENKELDSFIGVKYYNTDNPNIVILKNKENKYGLLELKDTGLVSLMNYSYDYLGIVENRVKDNIVITKEGTNWSLITIAGKAKVKNIEYEIKTYNENFIVINNNGKLYLMDYTKNFISSEPYLHIELLDNYNLFVTADNKLYIKDKDDNKMNEEGIPLYNGEYNKTLVYNEDGNLRETKFAYTYELINTKLNLSISEGNKVNEKSINLGEGAISAKYNFYSYFDGIIYFYKNGEKTELIGQYSCTNKNSLNESSSEFDKCFLASDEVHDDNDMVTSLNTSSVIPIFNERFVFIRDAEKLATEDAKIKLYDIKLKKILASYVFVNTYSRPGNIAIYHETVNKQVVVAKLKSGKMGAFQITADSVGSILSFEYETVEKLGDYLLVKQNNKWKIKENNTTDISAEFSEQIRGYSGHYLKTKVNNKYKVYGLNSTTPIPISGDLKYVEIISTVIAGVDNNDILTLYKTDGTVLVSDNLKLNTNEYYGTENKAFKITVANNTITVTIKGEIVRTYNLFDGTKIS